MFKLDFSCSQCNYLFKSVVRLAIGHWTVLLVLLVSDRLDFQSLQRCLQDQGLLPPGNRVDQSADHPLHQVFTLVVTSAALPLRSPG